MVVYHPSNPAKEAGICSRLKVHQMEPSLRDSLDYQVVCYLILFVVPKEGARQLLDLIEDPRRSACVGDQILLEGDHE